MATDEQDPNPEMAQAELNDVDFLSRFTFNPDLPPPDEWKDRTRRYPSQKNNGQNALPTRSPPSISRPLPPPPPPLPGSSLHTNTATETDLPDGPVQLPATEESSQAQPASNVSPEPASSLSSLSPPPSSESPPPTSHSTPSQSQVASNSNSVSKDTKQGSSSSESNRPRVGSKSKLAPPKRPPPPPPQPPSATATTGDDGKTSPPAQSNSTTETVRGSGTANSSQAGPRVNGVGAEPVMEAQTTAEVSEDQANVGSGLVTSNLKNDAGISIPGESHQSSLANEHSKGSGTVSPLLAQSWDNIEIPLQVED